MIKITFKLLKYIIVLALFAVSLVFAVVMTLSIWFINQPDYRKTQTAVEEESIQVEKKSKKEEDKITQVMHYLDFVDRAQENLSTLEPAKPICKTICSESNLDLERLERDPFKYLPRYYELNKNRSFDDFNFRHSLASAHSISKVVTPEMRLLILEAENITEQSWWQQAWLITRFQLLGARSLLKIEDLKKDFFLTGSKLKDLGELRYACSYQSARKVQKSCEDIMSRTTEVADDSDEDDLPLKVKATEPQ